MKIIYGLFDSYGRLFQPEQTRGHVLGYGFLPEEGEQVPNYFPQQTPEGLNLLLKEVEVQEKLQSLPDLIPLLVGKTFNYSTSADRWWALETRRSWVRMNLADPLLYDGRYFQSSHGVTIESFYAETRRLYLSNGRSIVVPVATFDEGNNLAELFPDPLMAPSLV